MYAEPARAYIDAHGGMVRTGASAKIHVADDVVVAVESGPERWSAPAVIAAVPWFALPDIFEPEPPSMATIIERARATASSPIVTVNLWFDRRVIDEPFIGLPGRAMQWVFDKQHVFGEEASHLSLVSSGAAQIAGQSNAELIALAHTELLEAIPAVRRSRLAGATVPRASRDLLAGAWAAGEARHAHARPRPAAGRRLDRDRLARYDRKRRPRGPPSRRRR